MNFRRFLSKRTIISISSLDGRVLSSYSGGYRSMVNSIVSTPTLMRDEFVRIISSSSAGGFAKDAQRMLGFMEARRLFHLKRKMNVAKSDAFHGRKTTR